MAANKSWALMSLTTPPPSQHSDESFDSPPKRTDYSHSRTGSYCTRHTSPSLRNDSHPKLSSSPVPQRLLELPLKPRQASLKIFIRCLNPPEKITEALETMREARKRLSLQLNYFNPAFFDPSDPDRLRILQDDQLVHAAESLTFPSVTATTRAAVVLLIHEEAAVTLILLWAEGFNAKGALAASEIKTLANAKLACIRQALRILRSELVPGLAKLSKSYHALEDINHSATELEDHVRKEIAKVWRKEAEASETADASMLVSYVRFLRSELRKRLDANAKDLAALSALIKSEHGGKCGLATVKVVD